MRKTLLLIALVSMVLSTYVNVHESSCSSDNGRRRKGKGLLRRKRA